MFLPVISANKEISGSTLWPDTPSIVLIPKRTNTIHPKLLIHFLILGLLITDAIPKPDSVIYNPSIKVMADTRITPGRKPLEAAVLNTIRHIGPTASCNNNPNRNPFIIIVDVILNIILTIILNTVPNISLDIIPNIIPDIKISIVNIPSG
jgi:hypothetical protein